MNGAGFAAVVGSTGGCPVAVGSGAAVAGGVIACPARGPGVGGLVVPLGADKVRAVPTR